MSSLPYYKRYARDALGGMIALTLEERGAYNTILDLIYDEGGPVRDDERMMCASLNCDPRVWRRLRNRLLEIGKIYLTDEGRISNRRADQELTSTEHKREVRRTLGAAGGKASAKTRQKGQQKQQNSEAKGSAFGVAIPEPEPEYSDTNVSGADGAVVTDFDKASWDGAVSLLTKRGGMTERAARSLFGRLLSANGVQARDLLASVTQATVNGSLDPASYLTKAAAAIGQRQAPKGPAKRLAFV